MKKAPACTKSDLRKMTYYLYENMSVASDYQDAALFCSFWYMLGRSSDLMHVRKQNLALDAGGVFFLRFVRVKASEKQGLSLFHDDD